MKTVTIAALLLAASAATSGCAKHDDPDNTAAALTVNDDGTLIDNGVDDNFSSDGVLSNASDSGSNALATPGNGF